jgi:hypothetical protein
MLTPTLKTPLDLLHKLQREQHRSFHAPHATHLADHLYNFCVTALGLRDHFFLAVDATKQYKEEFFELWAADPALRACSEIANTSKHGKLRSVPTTRSVTLATSTWVDVYMDEAGALVLDPDANHLDISVETAVPTALSLYDLTERVIGFWRGRFFLHGIAVEHQSEAEFFGQSGPEPAT